MGMKRLFIGLQIDAEPRQRLGAALISMRKLAQSQNLAVAWTKPENLHLTVKFLGETDASRVAEVTSRLEVLAAQTKPFALEFSSWGAFPDEDQAKVLWVAAHEPLGLLKFFAVGVEAAMLELGFPAEAREFVPHLTVARFKPGVSIKELLNPTRVSVREMGFGFSRVREVVLYESARGPGGSVYTPLASRPFQGA